MWRPRTNFFGDNQDEKKQALCTHEGAVPWGLCPHYNQGFPVWLSETPTHRQIIKYKKAPSFPLENTCFHQSSFLLKVCETQLIWTGRRGLNKVKIQMKTRDAVIGAAGETSFCNPGNLLLTSSLALTKSRSQHYALELLLWLGGRVLGKPLSFCFIFSF